MRGGIPGFNKTEIDLMCPEMAGWEAEVQRLVSGLAVTATMLCCGSAAHAQVVICPPLPPSYPRGWELMVIHASLMFTDLPTTHQLITLIQPTRTSVSGFIAGHICVPAGGGEDREASTEGDGWATVIAGRSEEVVG
jgi:hypothetical protein